MTGRCPGPRGDRGGVRVKFCSPPSILRSKHRSDRQLSVCVFVRMCVCVCVFESKCERLERDVCRRQELMCGDDDDVRRKSGSIQRDT